MQIILDYAYNQFNVLFLYLKHNTLLSKIYPFHEFNDSCRISICMYIYDLQEALPHFLPTEIACVNRDVGDQSSAESRSD